MCPIQKVMISSTVLDLARHRDIARDVCLRLRMLPVMMEYLTARSHGAIEESLRLVDDADVYVGIFAERYGWCVDASPSLTELEYERALARGIPILAFMVDDGNGVDEGEHARAKLAALKQRVAERWVTARCPTLTDFRENLFLALEPFRGEDRSSPHFVSDIPAPPRAYAAHPYTLLRSDQVVGRTQEFSAISQWASDTSPDAATVLAVIAIGGAGKSAMTWNWFNERAVSDVPGLAGRMWWSFYESDATFENFVIRALSYIMAVDRERVRRIPPREREERLLNFLTARPFAIVLDGLERLLTAYARTATAAEADPPDPADERNARLRGPRLSLDPHAGAFLQRLSRARASRMLISSRLVPADLEDAYGGGLLAGVRLLELRGLTDEAARVLAQSAGVNQVSSTLTTLFRQFDNYPLLIRALAGEIASHRPAPGDFDAWLLAHPDFDPVTLPVVQRKMHVLEFALRGLEWASARVLQVIASFRMPAPYASLRALLIHQTGTLENELELDRTLADLEERGLVGWDRRGNRYDVHPVIRTVVARHFGRIAQRLVYENTRQYLQSQSVTAKELLRTLDDFAIPVELFHTLVRLDQREEAWQVFKTHLDEQAMDRLNLCREAAQWLAELFPGGPTAPMPDLRAETRRSALWAHAFAYQKTGLLRDATQIWRMLVPLTTHPTLRCRLFGSLGRALTFMGELHAAEEAFRRGMIADERKYTKDVVMIGCRLADVLAIRNVPDVPEALFRASVALGERYRGEEHVIAAHVHFAHYLLRSNRIEEARDLLTRGRALLASTAIVRSEIELRSLAGHIALADGRLDTAVAELEGALNAARETQYVAISIEALTALGRVQMEYGDFSRATATFEQAINIAHHSSFRIFEAAAHLHLAEVHLATGNAAAATEAARLAAQLAWCDGGTHTAPVLVEGARALLATLHQPMPVLPEPPASRAVLPVVRELSKHRYGVEIA